MSDFNKGLIILGKPRTGKSLLARSVCAGYNKDEVVEINARGIRDFHNPFLFSAVTSKTRIILIDDLKKYTKLDVFYHLIGYGDLEVNKRGQAPFYVPLSNIKLIITSCEIKMKKVLYPSLNRRFDVIELKTCGHLELSLQSEKQNQTTSFK